MKVTPFLTIATASSLPAPSAAAAAPAKTSMAGRAETSGFVDQIFTFYLRIDGPGRSQGRTRQNCHKRANHPLRWLSVRQLTPRNGFPAIGGRRGGQSAREMGDLFGNGRVA